MQVVVGHRGAHQRHLDHLLAHRVTDLLIGVGPKRCLAVAADGRPVVGAVVDLLGRQQRPLVGRMAGLGAPAAAGRAAWRARRVGQVLAEPRFQRLDPCPQMGVLGAQGEHVRPQGVEQGRRFRQGLGHGWLSRHDASLGRSPPRVKPAQGAPGALRDGGRERLLLPLAKSRILLSYAGMTRNRLDS